MKFLKKDVSEGNAVSSVMDRLALAHPEIAFTYIKDGKVALKTTGDGKLRSAIYSVFGREFVNTLMPVDYTLDNVRVYGFISTPVPTEICRIFSSTDVTSKQKPELWLWKRPARVL